MERPDSRLESIQLGDLVGGQVLPYYDFIACKGEQRAREAGKPRLEGKENTVNDADAPIKWV